MEFNAFTIGRFKFLGLRMDGSRVLANISEDEGLLTPTVSYTQDERQTHGLLERTVEIIRSGDDRKRVRRNHDQLLAAFNAIRTYKAQNGLPLDVKDPCVY